MSRLVTFVKREDTKIAWFSTTYTGSLLLTRPEFFNFHEERKTPNEMERRVLGSNRICETAQRV